MKLFKRLFAATPDPREEVRPLWHTVVAQARQRDWYLAGVDDTIAGRFDMVTAVLAAVLLRMEASSALAPRTALLTELFVADMDGQLREFGIGDIVVGKHVGRLMSAMGGRLAAYRGALSGAHDLEEALGRNVTLRAGAEVSRIAEGLRALTGRLSRTDDAALLAGDISA